MSLLSDIAIAIKTKLGGTSTNNTIPRYDGTTCTLKKSNVTISDTDVVTAGGGFVGNLTGTASNATLAASATKLETARTINGVAFNGTSNITIADPTKAPLTGGGTSGTWGISITGNASTANNAALAANATKLATERFINGVAFDGTANITIADSTKAPLNGTGATGTWGINITGNSASATKLATARTINGVSFDGTANITVEDSTAVKLTGNQTISGVKTFSSSPIVPTPTTNFQVATKAYVDSISIPKGLISMWSGSIVSIPTGWVLCNGANGTPDLRDRFVIGAGSTYGVGTTGGSKDAVVVAHTHTGSTSSVGAHTHAVPRGGGSAGNGSGIGIDSGGSFPTSSAGAFSASLSTDSTGVSGVDKNLPPYYALAFIMKI